MALCLPLYLISTWTSMTRNHSSWGNSLFIRDHEKMSQAFLLPFRFSYIFQSQTDCTFQEVGPEPGDGGDAMLPRDQVSTERSACTNNNTYHLWTVYRLPRTLLSFLHTLPHLFSRQRYRLGIITVSV